MTGGQNTPVGVMGRCRTVAKWQDQQGRFLCAYHLYQQVIGNGAMTADWIGNTNERTDMGGYLRLKEKEWE